MFGHHASILDFNDRVLCGFWGPVVLGSCYTISHTGGTNVMLHARHLVIDRGKYTNDTHPPRLTARRWDRRTRRPLTTRRNCRHRGGAFFEDRFALSSDAITGLELVGVSDWRVRAII